MWSVHTRSTNTRLYFSGRKISMGSNPQFGDVRLTGYEKVKRWRANMKRKLVICFGSKCGICGLVDDDIVYDFHHLDPKEKEMRIAAKVQSWEKIVIEANKCVMLCSHCHRKVHAKMSFLPENCLRFNEDRIVVLSSKIKTSAR